MSTLDRNFASISEYCHCCNKSRMRETFCVCMTNDNVCEDP